MLKIKCKHKHVKWITYRKSVLGTTVVNGCIYGWVRSREWIDAQAARKKRWRMR